MTTTYELLQGTGRKGTWVWLIGGLTLAACAEGPAVSIDPAEESARLEDPPAVCTETPVISVEELARGLEVPWDMAPAPDGRIFVTERPGRIRVIGEAGLEPEPWATLDVYDLSEAGLMGIALSPDFATDGHVFVAATFVRSGPSLPSRLIGRVVRQLELLFGVNEGGASITLKVIRFTERDGRGVDPVTIVDDIPAHQLHAGAALAFAPDGTLFLTMGDGSFPSTSADPTDRRGSVLRYNADGSIPGDNPRPGEAVFAYGFRDVQGLAWHPADSGLYGADHGPTGLETEGLRRHRDELNRIVAGGDHGWPRVSGRVALDGTILPLLEWTPAVAPSGLDFHRGPDSPYYGDLFVGSLRGVALQRVVLLSSPLGDHQVRCTQPLLEGELGRIRGVRWDGEGLLISTSNRDRRGNPGEDDDRVLRVILTPP